MKTGDAQEEPSDQNSPGKVDSSKKSTTHVSQFIHSKGQNNNEEQFASTDASDAPKMSEICSQSSNLNSSHPLSRGEEENSNTHNESTSSVNNNSSPTNDRPVRRSGRKTTSTSKLTTVTTPATNSTGSNVPLLLVDPHSKVPLGSNVTQIAKNKHMAIKVVGKSELSTQDLVAKAKKMLTFLTRSKSAKKTIAHNTKPMTKKVVNTPINIKKVHVVNSKVQHQRFKDEIMKELIASTPSGFSVTKTYSGLRDRQKDPKETTTTSNSSNPSADTNETTNSTTEPITTAIACKPSTSTSTVSTPPEVSTIELFDDGLKPNTTQDVPNVNQTSYDLLSKNRCAISICKHMSGECNLASRTSESSDGRAWYNFLRVADPAYYTSPTCPMKQIFLCFCHFSPEYVVYAPRLRSHSIPTISLPRHLNQNSSIKDKSDRIKDERLLHKKLQDAETKIRELEYKVKNMNSILSKFSQDELRKIQGRAVKWSKGTLEKALSVRALVGPSAYEHISKLFPLPSLRVLNNLPDEFLKELNVDRLSFPSKNKAKGKDRTAKGQSEKETGGNKRRKATTSTTTTTTNSNSNSNSKSQTQVVNSREELNQALETIAPVSSTIPRTHLDEFASHALLDISHMYPSNPSMTSLSLSTLTSESASLHPMNQSFSEIDFSSLSAPMPFNPSVLSTPQTQVQTIHVTTIPSMTTCVATSSNSTSSDGKGKNSNNSSSMSSTSTATINSTKSKSASNVAAKTPNKRKLVITPRFGRLAPKPVKTVGKNLDVNDSSTNNTINLPDTNQLELNNSITMDIDLPPLELTSTSPSESSNSNKLNTYSNKSKNNSTTSKSNVKSPSSTAKIHHGKWSENSRKSSNESSSKNCSTSSNSDGLEPPSKKLVSRAETPIEFDLVDVENLSSKERITVFNVLTEIHIKFKALYHRCSTCCVFLHGDAINQVMRMVETNILKYSHFLSDLASSHVKHFQENMLRFVKNKKPDIFPQCPLYHEHLRFLIYEYISASILCKRSKASSSSTSASAASSSAVSAASSTLNSPLTSSSNSNVPTTALSTSSSLSSSSSTLKNSKSHTRKSLMSDIVTHTITSSDDPVKGTNVIEASKMSKDYSKNSSSQPCEASSTLSSSTSPSPSSASVTTALVN